MLVFLIMWQKYSPSITENTFCHSEWCSSKQWWATNHYSSWCHHIWKWWNICLIYGDLSNLNLDFVTCGQFLTVLITTDGSGVLANIVNVLQNFPARRKTVCNHWNFIWRMSLRMCATWTSPAKSAFTSFANIRKQGAQSRIRQMVDEIQRLPLFCIIYLWWQQIQPLSCDKCDIVENVALRQSTSR